MPTYDVRTWSSAPMAEVFALVSDVTTWPSWAGRMIGNAVWVQEGVPAPGGVGAIRKLTSGLLSTKEQILEYDSPHYVAYTIVSRQPIRDYRAIIALDPDEGGTRITWAGTFTARMPGTGRLLCWLLKRGVGTLATRLARYAGEHTQASS